MLCNFVHKISHDFSYFMYCCFYILQPIQVVLNAQAKETNLLIPQGVWVSRRCCPQREVLNVI